MDTFVWLEYPPTGGKAQFPARAAEVWRAKGWRDCEPPADTEPEPAAVVQAPPAEEPKPKSAGRKRGGETTTAPEE